MFTTNADDLKKAEQLQARLRAADEENDDEPATTSNTSTNSGFYRIPNVTLDEGKNKYVLISAILPVGGGKREHFVVSNRFAAYHRNAAEPMIENLERSGYSSIRVLGGGRIALDCSNKTVHIYGYSYGFGLADHSISKSVVEMDSRYQDYEVTWSNDGY